ncbi:hypothetical protein Btru_077685 [Bulinus truncatus]|nr:hypothetical protein Btru_077685 [Bulinus truncatus]
MNDAILLRTTRFGSPSDVLKLFQICCNNIAAFSNDALNKSMIPACYLGHAQLIRFLLQDGARLEFRDNGGNTPLLICSKQGMSDVVRFLLTMGANVNAANNDGDTALFLSTSRDVIQLLLGQTRINLNHRNKKGNTAVMAAIEHVQLEKVKCLIYSGACPNIHDTGEQCSCLNKNILVSSERDNALALANRKGVGRLVRLFYRSRRVKLSPLLLAAINSDFQSCNVLLRSNLCDVNEVSNISNILCLVLSRIQQEEIIGDTEIELVRRICDTGLNVNEYDSCHNSDLTNDIVRVKVNNSHTSNRPPLKIALEIGHFELVDILCTHGAKISHDDLVLTVDKHHVHLIPMLADHGAEMNKKDESGCIEYPKSALDVALASSDVDCARVLIKSGAHLDVQYAAKQTVHKCNGKVLEYLIKERREEIERVIPNDPDLIHTAANSRDVGILKLLLEAGADINVVLNNQTPLMQAVHIDVMKFLLENGADVNLKTNTTALINLFSWHYEKKLQKAFDGMQTSENITKKILERVVLFLKYDVVLNETDNRGSTALITCCMRSCNTSILKILLDKESKVVNHCDSNGLTALHFSVKQKNLDETKLLIQYGANVNMKCNAGNTPLHLAVKNVEVVKFLLDNDADVNAQNSDGDTALLYASQNFSDLPETVEVLIRSGSDVNHRNTEGLSALFLAVENAHEATMKVLLDAHCDLNDAVADDQPPKSVLSLVLNKWCPNGVSQNMALTLLKYGATSRYVRPDVIHRLILKDNDELIQKLILSGVCSSDIILNKKIISWPFVSISPFAICLIIDQINMAQFFIDRWYLTKSDITVLSRNKSIMDYMGRKNSETSQFLEKISSQPLRLELLCFISISLVLGSGPDRREKVQKCPIPNILQDCLMYNNFELKFVEPSGFNWHRMDLLKSLTINQIFKDDIDSEFYENDEFCSVIDSDSDLDDPLLYLDETSCKKTARNLAKVFNLLETGLKLKCEMWKVEYIS